MTATTTVVRDLYEHVPVTELREGDLVDLEDDRYADPDRDSRVFPYELAVVLGSEQETPECVRVDFDHDSVGFPTNHYVYRRVSVELVGR